MKRRIRNRANFWIPQKMTKIKDDKITSYKAYICPECDHESVIKTNYCSNCGKDLREDNCTGEHV